MESSTYTSLIKNMQKHAFEENPKECCGIITDNFKYIPYPNLADDPENFFILDPMAFAEHYDDCWGIFHSHPEQDNPIPSRNDIASTSFTEFNFIVGWKNKFYIYWYDENINALKFEKFTEEYLCKT